MRRPSASTGGVDQAGFSAALLDPERPCPAGLRVWNGSDPAARLAVHRNNVVSGLIDALADTFPVVRQLVGEDFFRAMAGVFVRQSPPRSPVLAHYGQDFPLFIAAFPPARSVPYLADVGRLEAARVRAYHAADAEPVSAATVSVALASGERMGELRVACHPSASVVASPFAVVSLWAAHQGDAEVEHLDADGPEHALVVRRGLDVLVLAVPVGTALFVTALQEGQNLGNAAEAPMRAAAGGPARTFDLTATLSLLLGHGVLTSIELPRRCDA